MFDPMPSGDPFQDLLKLVPWAIGLAGLVVGFLWIKKIVDDIEDN